jgi:hypothetical protein
MKEEMQLQANLFRLIKERLPSNISLVHDLSELLGISYDSAYRRIRGEKELSMEELQKICIHYRISVDSILNLHSENFLFQSIPVGARGNDFVKWLQNILVQIKRIHSCKEKRIIYSAKDVPIFHYFEFPRLFAFKRYFWHKVLFPESELKDQLFSPALPDELTGLCREILSYYNKIPTIEIWNIETFDSILNQIEYCHVSGFFKENEDIVLLCDDLEILYRHLEHQVECGFRYFYGSAPEGEGDWFKMYVNDILLGDNTIFVLMDGTQFTFLTYNVISLLITTNPVFCKEIETSLMNLTRQSMLISGTAAKERNRFFRQIIGKIQALREKAGK